MPLSWGRRYCVYKYQGFLFYIVTLVLSNVHAFRIGSFLFLPRFSRYRRYRLYPIFSLEYRYGSSHRSLPRRSVPPRKPPGIHGPIAGPRVAPEKRPSVINAMVSTNSGSEAIASVV